MQSRAVFMFPRSWSTAARAAASPALIRAGSAKHRAKGGANTSTPRCVSPSWAGGDDSGWSEDHDDTTHAGWPAFRTDGTHRGSRAPPRYTRQDRSRNIRSCPGRRLPMAKPALETGSAQLATRWFDAWPPWRMTTSALIHGVRETIALPRRSGCEPPEHGGVDRAKPTRGRRLLRSESTFFLNGLTKECSQENFSTPCLELGRCGRRGTTCPVPQPTRAPS